MHYCQSKKISGVGLDDIYIGNGASELIVMAMQGLLNTGDEVLVPAPITAVDGGGDVGRRHAAPLHLRRTERVDAGPRRHAQQDHAEHPRHRHHQPEQSTGALYSDELLREVVEIAREHQLIIFADEIYDKMLYDGATHTSIASLADDVLFLTLNGLSKNYRACGYRAGWMVVSAKRNTRRITSTV